MSPDDSEDHDPQGLPTSASLESRERMSWVLIGLIAAICLSPIALRLVEVEYTANPGVILAVGSIIIALLLSDRATGRL